jgi:hypothetical protein
MVMGTHIRGRDGKFAGSIGDGKTRLPTAAPYTLALPAQPSADRVILLDSDGHERTVTVGNLDSARRVLTAGQCHSFAAALHYATGFPIVGFTGGHYIDEDDDDGHMSHFAVLSPDGYVIDGDGVVALETLVARTGWAIEEIGDTTHLREALGWDTQQYDRVWAPLNPLAVSSFTAPAILLYESRTK